MKQGVFRSLLPSGVGQYVGNGGVCNSGGLDYDYHIPCYHVA